MKRIHTVKIPKNVPYTEVKEVVEKVAPDSTVTKVVEPIKLQSPGEITVSKEMEEEKPVITVYDFEDEAAAEAVSKKFEGVIEESDLN